MSNPLDSILAAYETTRNAFKVLHRCVKFGPAWQERPFRNTTFHRQEPGRIAQRLDEANAELDKLALFSLYAGFEARLRDHVSGHAGLLRSAAGPDRQFGEALADEFGAYIGGPRFGKLIELFGHAVGEDLIAKAGAIRKFRHWVAHGRRGPAPPSVPPRAAYKTLTEFLTLARLA
jgi:hypothetical protein